MEHFDMYKEMLLSPEFALDESDSDDTLDSLMGDPTSASPQRSSKKRSSKPCKYVPHAEKSPQLVQRRNARERRRVEAVNTAFIKLRKIVPAENKHKRLSKVKTLRTAIDYIRQLQDLIQDYDGNQQHPQPQAVYASASPPSYSENSRWMQHSNPQQHQHQRYHQETRLPSYCSNDDSSGQWTSSYSESYLHTQSSPQGDHYPLNMNHAGHYGYIQESSAVMYTQRAVAHLASVS